MVEKIASDRIRSRLNVHSAKSQQTIAMLVPDLASVVVQERRFEAPPIASGLLQSTDIIRPA